MDPTTAWLIVLVATALTAAVCGPLGLIRRWPKPLMATGIVATAVLVSTSIVQAFSWRALSGFLLVLFPVHAVAFGIVAVVRRRPRYAFLIATFAALTGVSWIGFHELDAPRTKIVLRAVAIAGTLAGIGAAIVGRRSDAKPRSTEALQEVRRVATPGSDC